MSDITILENEIRHGCMALRAFACPIKRTKKKKTFFGHWFWFVNMANPNSFPYDIFSLIECVESKPCLWDKTLAVYKDRIQKRNAWREVCIFLEPLFDSFVDKKKDEITNEITGKWKNIKSAFMRSLKCKSGQAKKKNYMYATNMQFLLKVMTPEDTTESGGYENPALELSSTDENNRSVNNIDTNPPSENNRNVINIDTNPPSENNRNVNNIDTNAPSPPHPLPQSRNRKRSNPVDTEILRILQQTDTRSSDFIDEDRAFFHSILPHLRQLTHSEKLDFKVQVMQLLQKFSNIKNRQNPPTAGAPNVTSHNSHANHDDILDHDLTSHNSHAHHDDILDHDLTSHNSYAHHDDILDHDLTSHNSHAHHDDILDHDLTSHNSHAHHDDILDHDLTSHNSYAHHDDILDHDLTSHNSHANHDDISDHDLTSHNSYAHHDDILDHDLTSHNSHANHDDISDYDLTSHNSHENHDEILDHDLTSHNSHANNYHILDHDYVVFEEYLDDVDHDCSD